MPVRVPAAWALLLAVSMSPAAAQQPALDNDRAAIDTCLRDTQGAPDHCIGIVYMPCTEDREGSTTRGMQQCASREMAVWQEKIDDSMKKLSSGPFGATEAQPWNRPPENKRERMVPGTDILNDMAKTWTVWRAKKCDALAMQAEGGSLSRVIYGACLYDETARHALWLRTVVDDTAPK